MTPEKEETPNVSYSEEAVQAAERRLAERYPLILADVAVSPRTLAEQAVEAAEPFIAKHYEEKARARWAHGGEPDISPGDVIAAEPDGTITLDDGITTWNPSRAAAFLVAAARKEVVDRLHTPAAVEAFNAALPGTVRHSTVDTIAAFRAALPSQEVEPLTNLPERTPEQQEAADHGGGI